MTTVQMLLLKNLMEPLLMVKKSKLTVPEVVVVVAVEVAAVVVDSAADLEAEDSEAATATVAAAAVVDTVAETATAEAMVEAVGAAAEASVEAAEAAAEAEVEAVITVIKMVTSHENAPNKGKSATRSSPPGVLPRLTKGVEPPLFEPTPPKTFMTVAELMYDQRGLLIYPLLLLLRNHSLSIYCYPHYQCIFVKILTITWFTS